MPQVWIPYCGVAPSPADWLGRWNFDPWLVAALAAALAAIWTLRSGRERRLGLAAIAVLAISFVSPLCALSSALFAARTLHHVLLVTAAAPLLAWTLPRTRPGGLAIAAFAHLGLFWLWHAPAAYALALSHDGLYWLMQISLLGSALWFWRAVRSTSAPAAVAALIAAVVGMGLLGALITFAATPLYAPHLTSTWAFGLDPLHDQQIAGLIMWAPAALAYLGAALMMLGGHLASTGSKAQIACSTG